MAKIQVRESDEERQIVAQATIRGLQIELSDSLHGMLGLRVEIERVLGPDGIVGSIGDILALTEDLQRTANAARTQAEALHFFEKVEGEEGAGDEDED
jgi:hypothetical protein